MTEEETIIRPDSPWWRIPWRELADYRELLWFVAKRNFTVAYKQTILGPLWFVAGPLATTVVFTVIFGHLAKLRTDGSAPFLFYLSGTLFWNFFSACLHAASSSLSSNAHLFGKVYFPRLVMPLASVLTCLPRLVLGLVIFGGAGIAFHFAGNGPEFHPLRLLALPPLVLFAALAGLGTGLVFAALSAKYRDLRFASSMVLRLWFYATPVIYPASYFAPRFHRWLGFNPMAPVEETARWALLGSGSVNPAMLAIGAASAVAIFLAGVAAFNRVERTFIDVV